MIVNTTVTKVIVINIPIIVISITIVSITYLSFIITNTITNIPSTQSCIYQLRKNFSIVSKTKTVMQMPVHKKSRNSWTTIARDQPFVEQFQKRVYSRADVFGSPYAELETQHAPFVPRSLFSPETGVTRFISDSLFFVFSSFPDHSPDVLVPLNVNFVKHCILRLARDVRFHLHGYVPRQHAQ